MYLPVESFKSLQTELLSAMELALLDGTLSSRAALLEFYSALINQWGVKLRTQPSVSDESVPLSRAIRHAELLASSVLEFLPANNDAAPQVSKPSVVSVLEFYRNLADLFSHASSNAHIRLTVPLAPSVYTVAFTPSLSTLSILNSILAGYKSAFESSLTSTFLEPENPPEPLYATTLVSRFNGYIMDMCNLLWRNRALNEEDPNALGCLIPTATVTALTDYISDLNETSRRYDRESAFNASALSIFSLSYHVALCNLSAACFADIEEEQNVGTDRPRLRKPVNQKALQALEKDGGAKVTWQEYRVQMLDWLDAVGSRGTSDLMRSTMKALRKE